MNATQHVCAPEQVTHAPMPGSAKTKARRRSRVDWQQATFEVGLITQDACQLWIFTYVIDFSQKISDAFSHKEYFFLPFHMYCYPKNSLPRMMLFCFEEQEFFFLDGFIFPGVLHVKKKRLST
ncbi:hypothetical protein ACLBKS_03230 [Hylemonella sp. W303a]|uniref:hypothetical protein n=1 Tax=Hylemonella sp. W303a TaxID=3389873 RepID=UPI00396B0F49